MEQHAHPFTYNEILQVIVALLSVVAVALPLWIQNRHLKKQNEKLKQDQIDLSQPIIMDLMSFNKLNEVVNSVFDETTADRFLILYATNGKVDMRFCTAIYEQHREKAAVISSIGATNRYVRFQFDSEYRSILKRIEQTGGEFIDTEKLASCDLKNIYVQEGVTAAKVFFLRRAPIDDANDRLFYCSFVTRSSEKFDAGEQVILKSYLAHIKSIIENFK